VQILFFIQFVRGNAVICGKGVGSSSKCVALYLCASSPPLQRHDLTCYHQLNLQYQLLVPISHGLCLDEVSFAAPPRCRRSSTSLHLLANHNLGSKNWPLIRTRLGDGIMIDDYRPLQILHREKIRGSDSKLMR